MRNQEMARDYLHRARRCLKEAELAVQDGDAPGALRRSQEALEMAAKATLRYLGVEYPREHDVSDALPEIEGRLPDHFRQRIGEFKRLLSELTKIRGPAMYGYERQGIPASKAFSMDYAKQVFAQVRELVDLCAKFIG